MNQMEQMGYMGMAKGDKILPQVPRLRHSGPSQQLRTFGRDDLCPSIPK